MASGPAENLDLEGILSAFGATCAQCPRDLCFGNCILFQ
jgi:hypothetical protein